MPASDAGRERVRGWMNEPKLSVVWAMPNKATFSIPPIAAFLARWLHGCAVIIDPFAGRSTIGTLKNDLGYGGIDAAEWCIGLLPELEGKADAVLFDPPYSPRQISECYSNIGRETQMEDTQNGALYRRVRIPLARLLKPKGVALSFGWQSSGFGKNWPTHEIMLVRHGGAHNDTICVAQTKDVSQEALDFT